MQDIRSKKLFILEAFLKNRHLNIKKFALENNINANYIERIIREYKFERTISHPIYCIKSLGLEDTYYLFSNDEEKKLEVSSGIIKNNVSLTEYERYWLGINKGFYLKGEKYNEPTRNRNFIENEY